MLIALPTQGDNLWVETDILFVAEQTALSCDRTVPVQMSLTGDQKAKIRCHKKCGNFLSLNIAKGI